MIGFGHTHILFGMLHNPSVLAPAVQALYHTLILLSSTAGSFVRHDCWHVSPALLRSFTWGAG